MQKTTRRIRIATIAGAVLALGGLLLAVPTAASAAETQNCVMLPTPETQPAP
jgi:hypothetical protein